MRNAVWTALLLAVLIGWFSTYGPCEAVDDNGLGPGDDRAGASPLVVSGPGAEITTITVTQDSSFKFSINSIDKILTDYIFNINNQDDLITCIQGGLTAEGIVNFHNKVRSWVIPTPHFLFGYNHKEMTPMGSDNIVDAIVAVLDELLDNIIAYPWVEEYRAVYTHYISNKIIGD